MNIFIRWTSERPGVFKTIVCFFIILPIFCVSVGLSDHTVSADSFVSSACEIDYPPFCIVDADGNSDGFSVELLRATLAAMGREATFKTGAWVDIMEWLKQGKVQMLPLVGRTPERENIFDFTFPYMSLHGAIVIRDGTTDIKIMNDLRGKRVAVMKDDNAEEFLRREDRGIEIHTTATYDTALQGLSAGRYDAVVIQRLVALRLISENNLTNLKVINQPIPGFRQDFCFAVREGDRQTLALLNEGLALVTADGTYNHLHSKWFAALELPTNRRIIIGGDYNYPPYEYLDENGRPAGYNVDLMRAVAQEVGLDIEIRLGPWSDIVQELEQGEIDGVMGMLYSTKRALKFGFTPPHLVNSYVSVIRKGEGDPPETVADLISKRIVVQRGDIMQDFAIDAGLKEQTTNVDSQEEALREIIRGQYDCALVSRLTAMYLIDKNGWDTLKVGRHSLLSPSYCIAVHRDHKAFLAQLTEGLKILEETGQYRRIYEKWMGVYDDNGLRLVTIFHYITMVTVPLLLILLLSFAWSWSLRKQVARRTEDLLRSEEQFRSLVEGAPETIFVQTDFCFSYINPSGCKLFGAQSRDQLIGQSVMERFHPSIQDKIHDRMCRLNEKQERVATIDEVFIRLDGTEVPVEVSAVPFMYKGKNGALVFVRDITERKQAEKLIERRDTMLARTEGIAHIGSWEWDVRTDTVVWSDELFKIFKRDPARGAPSFSDHAELYPPEDIARLQEAVEEAVSKGTHYECELRALRPDGTIRHCLAQGYPDKDADGKVVRLYGSLQDITELNRAQSRIIHLNNVLRAIRDVNQLIVREHSRERLIQEACRLMVETRGYISSLIILTDEQDRIIMKAEAGGEKSFGFLRKEIERGTIPACFDQARNSDEALLIKNGAEMCAGCGLSDVCPDSDKFCVRLVNDGEAYGYLAVSIQKDWDIDSEEKELFVEMAGDIAYALRVLHMNEVREKIELEHKSLQNQIIQAQKMESVGQLAGGVAHDYNNVLTVIIGYTEMLMAKVGPLDQMYMYLEEILTAANRSAEITRQLLAFASKQTVSPKVLNVNATVESMLKMLKRLIGEDIHLVWRPGNDLWPVKIDPSQVDQILANLCVNARDAITGVGNVSIETSNVTFDENISSQHAGFKPGDYVLLAVSDDGCGMDKETLSKVFEPFFTTKSINQGTGLGLATVYGIVKQNNGFVHVYSEPENGTTFKIYLTREKSAVQEKGIKRSADIPTGNGEVILLVEDDPAIMKMGRTMLEKTGYTVLVAETPGTAVNLARECANEIQLLITDVIMPEMNGNDLALKLLALYPSIKVLFMSGYTANVIAHRGILKEDVNFIQKPFVIQDLARKIRSVLDGD